MVLFWLWQQIRYRKKLRYVYFVPPVLLLWSNMHASYLVGLGVFGLLVIGDCLDGFRADFEFSRPLQMRCWSMILVSLLVLVLVKPLPDFLWVNFLGGFLGGGLATVRDIVAAPQTVFFLGNGVSPGNITDGELLKNIVSFHRNIFLSDRASVISGYSHPINYLNLRYVQACLSFLPIGILSFAVLAKKRRLSNGLLALFMMVVATGRLRTLGFVPLVIAPLLFIKYDQDEFKSFVRLTGLTKTVVLVALTLLVLVSSYHLVNGSYHKVTNIHAHNVSWGVWDKYSDSVPEKLLRRYPDKRFYNNFGIGSFLIWKWWPYKKVFFDSKWVPYRMEFVRNRLRYFLDMKLSYAVLSRDIPRLHRPFLMSTDWRILLKDGAMISYHRTNN
jgi:hypothetical protein